MERLLGNAALKASLGMPNPIPKKYDPNYVEPDADKAEKADAPAGENA